MRLNLGFLNTAFNAVFPPGSSDLLLWGYRSNTDGTRLIDNSATGDYEVEPAVSLSFDGVSSYCELVDDNGDATSVTIPADTDFVIRFGSKNTGNTGIVVGYSTIDHFVYFQTTGTEMRVKIDGNTYVFTLSIVKDHAQYELYRIDNQLSLYENDILIDTLACVTSTFIISLIGANVDGTSNRYTGDLYDIYIATLDAEENETPLLSNYLAQGSDSDICVSEIGPHVKLYNFTLPTDYAESVLYGHEWSNYSMYDGTEGETIAGETVKGTIPADPDNTSYDVAGNTLTNPGTPQRNFAVTGYAGTWDGVAYLVIAALTGSETVTYSDGTATPTVSAGQIDFTAGWCSRVTLDDGTDLVIESSDTSLQADIWDVSGNGNHATLTNATLPFFTTEKEGSYLLARGFDLDGDDYIPANPSTGLSALGQTLTNLPRILYPTTPVSIEQVPNLTGYIADATSQVDADTLLPLDPINFFYEPDGDAISHTASELLPGYGEELWDDDSVTADTGWTDNADGSYTTDGTVGNISVTATTTDEALYKVGYTLSGTFGGTDADLKIRLGLSTADAASLDANGTFVTTVEALGNDGTIIFRVSNTNDFIGTISDISVKEITNTGVSDINNQYAFGFRGLFLYLRPILSSTFNKLLAVINPFT